METPPVVPLDFHRRPEAEMRARAAEVQAALARRRSVRAFSDEPVPLDAVRACIAAAATAPSGANKQPWTFVLVTDPEVKRRIREAAEAEEDAFYGGRAGERWLADLEALGTGPEKPYLETAPCLVVVFARRHGEGDSRHYYVQESVGIACGMLIAALHLSGLATLTHTPSPMGFLSEILERPESERPYLLLPVGYPADGCVVPDIRRRPIGEVLVEVGPEG